MVLPNQPTDEERLAWKGGNDTRSKNDLLPGVMASLALWGFAWTNQADTSPLQCCWLYSLLNACRWKKPSHFVELNRPRPPKMLVQRNLTRLWVQIRPTSWVCTGTCMDLCTYICAYKYLCPLHNTLGVKIQWCGSWPSNFIGSDVKEISKY